MNWQKQNDKEKTIIKRLSDIKLLIRITCIYWGVNICIYFKKKLYLVIWRRYYFYNYKKETVKIRYPHDVNIILVQNIQKYIQFSDLEKDGETLFYSLLQ